MATPVGRIEKEFLFKIMYEEKLNIMHIKEGEEYTFVLDSPAGDELIFRPEKPVEKIFKVKSSMDMLFNYKGQVIEFAAVILSHKDGNVICKSPDIIYKNLDRNFLRVDTPSDIKIIFTFKGDRYNLSFPKITEYEDILSGDIFRNFDPRNLSGLIKQITAALNHLADGFKIVNFKEKKPETTEERVVSETGKTLFLPSTLGVFPKTDPYPRKRIITEEIFKRYLESTGVSPHYLDENCARFIKNKFNDGIYSDAWVPILFHEYVVGYIHFWIDKEGKLPFDFSVLDTVYSHSKVLAFSLKENGYFEHGKMAHEAFEGKVLDISASGLLFAYPHGSHLAATLLVDSELTVLIEAPKRTVNVVARIVRRYRDKSANYFGCRFTNMAPEDTRFLFEHLYGRQIDDSDSSFLSGQV
ncbi:MAG: PilZ domain-containing protein [Treponema sp.]|jgi:hypothetical protein|nr:PilZ domain-containing protein [Treponema sp.]